MHELDIKNRSYNAEFCLKDILFVYFMIIHVEDKKRAKLQSRLREIRAFFTDGAFFRVIFAENKK